MSSSFAFCDPRSTSTTMPLPKRPRSSCTQRIAASAVSVTSIASNSPAQFEQLAHPASGVSEPTALGAPASSPK